MNRKRSLKAREVNAAIEARGGYIARQKGSHRLYKVDREDITIAATVVPQHTGDIPNGTLTSIERDMEPAFGKGWLR